VEFQADIAERLDALTGVLTAIGPAAVAVSGGVDSMTLGTLAHRRAPGEVTMFHAVSPAVPAEATRRVRALAKAEGWTLQVVDAGEFADPAYRANPVNRCYRCKTNLYGTIRPLTGRQILSGANIDDLAEYRPGLDAAREHGVRHPYVEAAVGKAAVRAIARRLGLGGIAELPASPCLSSRIETGIGIEAETLARVHAAELHVGRLLRPQTVRCRVRASGVVIELDQRSFAALDDARRAAIAGAVGRMFDGAAVSIAPYRTGSAFLVDIPPADAASAG
jgi:uncharacterized protein